MTLLNQTFKKRYSLKKIEIWLYEIKKSRHTRGEISSRTCKATHINLELKASESSLWHIKGPLSRDVVNS